MNVPTQSKHHNENSIRNEAEEVAVLEQVAGNLNFNIRRIAELFEVNK